MNMAIIQNIYTRRYEVLLLTDDVIDRVRILATFKTFKEATKWIEPVHVYDHFPEEED